MTGLLQETGALLASPGLARQSRDRRHEHPAEDFLRHLAAERLE
jgi:hypothetical protein